MLKTIQTSKHYRYAVSIRRHGGVVASVLVPRLSSQDSFPGQRNCVVFLGKTLSSYSASLHPDI